MKGIETGIIGCQCEAPASQRAECNHLLAASS